MNRLKTIVVAAVLGCIPVCSLSQNGDIIAHLSAQRLLDSANYYFERGRHDTALIWYSPLIDSPVGEDGEILIEALEKAAFSYYHMYDYRRSYELLIRALDLCEKYGNVAFRSKIYVQIGSIYYRFGKFDIARSYDLKALEFCRDSLQMVGILNNLGDTAEGADSVLYYLNRALGLSKRHGDAYLNDILLNMALYYQGQGQFDEALRHFHMALGDAHRKNNVESEAENLYLQSKLFRERGRIDSALRYIDRSNTLATQHHILRIQADNYLALSELEEQQGHNRDAFEHFKIYTKLRDSIFNTEIFGDISQYQRLYEVSKTNRQIEQLILDQQIKRRIILYQMITVAVLVLACVVFLSQKRNLNRAYKALVAKNLTIIEYQDGSRKKHPEKYQKSGLTSDMQQELLDKILAVMEDTPTICDTEFSLDKLAERVHSNHAYVSQVINNTLHKNFRSFLYDYRIREAQRLFLEPDTAKYTIEAVALQVGFKSRTAFREAFREITGVSPSFYIKSMSEQFNP